MIPADADMDTAALGAAHLVLSHAWCAAAPLPHGVRLPDPWLTAVHYVFFLGGGGIDGAIISVGDAWDDARLDDV